MQKLFLKSGTIETKTDTLRVIHVIELRKLLNYLEIKGLNMEKYFNHLSIAASIVGGICVSFLGEWISC